VGKIINREKVREAIGERLLMVLTDMTLVAKLREPKCRQVLIIKRGSGFVPSIRDKFAGSLGLDTAPKEFDEMMSLLAAQFLQWADCVQTVVLQREASAIYLSCPELSPAQQPPVAKSF
jgi:hypothetical protein